MKPVYPKGSARISHCLFYCLLAASLKNIAADNVLFVKNLILLYTYNS